jgi:hypothetical protein
MDSSRFDALARSVSHAVSRRGALAALLAGSLLSRLAPPDTAGKGKRRRGKGAGKGRGRGKTRGKGRNGNTPRRSADQTASEAVCFSSATASCTPKPRAYLAKCDFGSTTALKNVNCTSCNLSGANLKHADASGANFGGANLGKACLVDADLRGARINRSTNTSGAVFCRTTMPNGSINNSGCNKGTACCPTCLDLGRACGNGIAGACCGGATCQDGVCACPASKPHRCGGSCQACCEDTHCSGQTPSCCEGACKGCCDAADCGGNACCDGSCCPREDDVCHENACCTPRSCPAGACGSMPDGCGGTLQCGGCGNPTPVCAANACHACSAERPCPAGEVCCAGSCFRGDCCDDDACPPAGNVCQDHRCRCGTSGRCAGATPRCCDGVCGECCANRQCLSGICCGRRCCALEEVCDTSVDPERCCRPAVCPANGCGQLSDGCGTTLECGECRNPTPICANNTCIPCSATHPCPTGCCHQGQCIATADCPAPANQCREAVCGSDGLCTTADKPIGTPCDDGNACTRNTGCSRGACVGGEPVDCDDGLSCTANPCDRIRGCQTIFFPDSCLIEGACYDDGESSPDDACLICDSAKSTSSWTQAPVGWPCDPFGAVCTRCNRCSNTCLPLKQPCATDCDCCEVPGAVVRCLSSGTGPKRCCKSVGVCGDQDCCIGCSVSDGGHARSCF